MAQDPFCHDARRQQIVKGLDACLESAQNDTGGLLVGELSDRLGEASFCFLSILLSVPFFQPISLGPLTMASGGVFLLVGWQMGKGCHHLELPEKIRSWHLRGKGWTTALRFCRALLLWLSKWTRPRMESWVDGEKGGRFIGWLIFVGGGLLAIPFANMPLNNTFPALMIFFAAVAWLERDGLMAAISLFWGAVTVLYFIVMGWLFYFFGQALWDWFYGFFK